MNQGCHSEPPSIPVEEKQELLRSLLQKEGNWLHWGRSCQKLQQAGMNPLEIFEQTGFQGSQQNLIIVAVQVYESLVKASADESLLEYYSGPRSDILYEFRILNQAQRIEAAMLARDKKLDAGGAKEVARSIQDFSRLSQPPSGFTLHPGDAVAYQYWKNARQKKNLQDRARLIAEALKFVHSQTAREQIEKLLTDFTLTREDAAPAPLLPVYRLETGEELPYIVPVAGTLPLSPEAIESVSPLAREEPFGAVKVKNESKSPALVALPGWQAILKAREPVVIFCQSQELPKELGGKPEVVLVVVDKSVREWDINSYFLMANNHQLEFNWFAEKPDLEILGKLVLVLRPKKILDENNLVEPWQMDD